VRVEDPDADEDERDEEGIEEDGEGAMVASSTEEDSDDSVDDESEGGESCGRICSWSVSLEVKNTMGQSGPNTAWKCMIRGMSRSVY